MMWQCSQCTFAENPDTFLACDCCGTARAASGATITDGGVEVPLVEEPPLSTTPLPPASGTTRRSSNNIRQMVAGFLPFNSHTVSLGNQEIPFNDKGVATFQYKHLTVVIKVPDDTEVDDKDQLFRIYTRLNYDKSQEKLQVLQQAMELNYDRQQEMRGGCLGWDKEEDALIYSYTSTGKDAQEFHDIVNHFLHMAVDLSKRFDVDLQATEKVWAMLKENQRDNPAVQQEDLAALLAQATSIIPNNSNPLTDQSVWALTSLVKESNYCRQEIASSKWGGIYSLLKAFGNSGDRAIPDQTQKTQLALLVIYLLPALDSCIIADLQDGIQQCLEYVADCNPRRIIGKDGIVEQGRNCLATARNEKEDETTNLQSILQQAAAKVSDKQLAVLAKKQRIRDILHQKQKIKDISNLSASLESKVGVDSGQERREAIWLLMTMAQQSITLREMILYGQDNPNSFQDPSVGLSLLCQLFRAASTAPPDKSLQGLAALTVAYLLPSVPESIEQELRTEIKPCIDFLRNYGGGKPIMVNPGTTVTVEEIQAVAENRANKQYTRHAVRHAVTTKKSPPTNADRIVNSKNGSSMAKSEAIVTAPKPISGLKPPPTYHNVAFDGGNFKSMKENKDIAGLFQWLSSDTGNRVKVTIEQVLEALIGFVEKDEGLRGDAVSLGSKALDPLLTIIEGGYRLRVKALASMVLAYLFCFHLVVPDSAKYRQRIMGALDQLEQMEPGPNETGIPSRNERFYVVGAAKICWKGHHGAAHLEYALSGIIDNHVDQQKTTDLVSMLCDNARLWVFPQLKMKVFVYLLKLAESNAKTQLDLMVGGGVFDSALLTFYSTPSIPDCSLRTVTAMLVASLLRSENLLVAADDLQKQAIRDCVDFLCSATRDLIVHKPTSFASGSAIRKPESILMEVSAKSIVVVGEKARATLAHGAVHPAIPISDEKASAAEYAQDHAMVEETANSTQWACGTCTFAENSIHESVCQICGSARNSTLGGEKGAATIGEARSSRGLRVGQRDDIAGLLKELTLCTGSRQLKLAVTLMNTSERNPDAREQMIAFDAFSYLLSAYRATAVKNRELRSAFALTIAYLLGSCYPRRIPSLTREKRREILSTLDLLRDSKRGIAIDSVKLTPQTLSYVSNTARNYFNLLDSNDTKDFQHQLIDGTRAKVARDTTKRGRQMPRPSLVRGQNLGAVASGIESYVYFLGSRDINRKLDAILALTRIAKRSPAQCALMLNYGVVTRLVDVVSSAESAANETLKVAAALSLACIIPTLDVLSYTSNNGAQESLEVLSAWENMDIKFHGVQVSAQEIKWAITSLRQCASSKHDASRHNDSVSSHDGGNTWGDDKIHGGGDNSGNGMVSSNVDLDQLYAEKKVAELLFLLRNRTCRMLDAALLLLVLVKDDEETKRAMLSNGGIESLLKIFFHWRGTSDQLRLAVASIVALLAPLITSSSDPQNNKISECLQFVETKEAEAQRVMARALNKVKASLGFIMLEPTSYTYLQEDGLVGMIQANSLGLVCNATSFLWDVIIDCQFHTTSPKSVKLTTKDPSNLAVVFSMLNEDIARQLVDDVLGRRRVAQLMQESSKQPSDLKQHSIPRQLDISIADRPGFLGVSVWHLENHFLPDVQACEGFSGSSMFKDIENLNKPTGFVRERGKTTVCPIDGKMGAAYVHCLEGKDHVGLANHMLSWTWSYSVRDVVKTLVSYCEKNSYDPKRTYVWICCLCLNQHRVAASDMSGADSSTASPVDFQYEFKRRVNGIGRLLVMMKPWGDPANLKRVWCIFECFMALKFDCEVSIVMPPRESDHLTWHLFSDFGNTGTNEHGIDSLYKALNNVDLEKAEASVETDRLFIHQLIKETFGFQKVNSLVRDRLRGWAREVIDSLVKEREQHEESPENDIMADSQRLSYCAFLKKVGDIYDLYGDYPAAHRLYDKCLSLRLSVRGTEHLDVAESCTDLGRTLFSQGKLKESMDMYEEALRIRENHDRNHLDTAKTYFHVGRLLQEMGDNDHANVMLHKCLTIQDDAGSLRDAAVTRTHIAYLLGEGDDDAMKQQALMMAQRALETLHQHFGPGREHPDTAFCYSVMSSILQETHVDRALSLIDQCRSIQESVLGNRHPSLAITCNRHGDIFRRQGKLSKAKKQYEQALEIYLGNVGFSPVPIARTYANLCVVASFLKDHEKAKEYHNNVLTTLESLEETPIDQNLVLTYSGAGEELFDREEHELAVVLFRSGLEVMEIMLGKDHPDLAAGHEAVAVALYNKGDYSGAVIEYKRSLTIKTATMDEDNSEVLRTTELIAGTTRHWIASRKDSFYAQ